MISKKKTPLAILLLVPYCLFAQDRIEGIGIFKVGQSTTDVVNEAAKGFRKGIKQTVDDRYEKDGSALFRLVYADTKKNPYQASACPLSEVYYLQRYIVSDIKITDIYLYFYKGVLIQFLSNGSQELQDALEIKYGNPKRSQENKPSECLGKIEREFTSVWENGNIEASRSTSFSYPSCRIFSTDYFSIRIPQAEREAANCDKEYRRKLMNPDKINKLKDL